MASLAGNAERSSYVPESTLASSQTGHASPSFNPNNVPKSPLHPSPPQIRMEVDSGQRFRPTAASTVITTAPPLYTED